MQGYITFNILPGTRQLVTASYLCAAGILQCLSFFTSYARDNKTRYLEKFVRELSQQVLDKTNFPPEQIGFFDGSNIGPGQGWVRVLGDALRTCKVIVCLCTPRSLNSQFCGKRCRYSCCGAKTGSATWQREQESWDRLPSYMGAAAMQVLEKFQFTDNALPRKYVEKGLNALSQVSREQDNFRTVVITLANASETRSTSLLCPNGLNCRPSTRFRASFTRMHPLCFISMGSSSCTIRGGPGVLSEMRRYPLCPMRSQHKPTACVGRL